MKPIRVLIVEMPQLMTDIARQIIARQPDMEVVDVVGKARELPCALPRSRADVLLCRTDTGVLPAVYRELFDSHPHLRLLAIETGDRSGGVYELRPARTPLDVWPDGLVDAIRSAGRSPRPFSWDSPAADQP